MTQRTVHGIDLAQPDGIARLLAWRRGRHGGLQMRVADPAADQQQGQQGGQPDGQSGGAQGGQQGGDQGGQSTAGGQAGGQQGGQDDATKLFTQKDLDRIIGERVAAEKTKADQRIAEAQALAGKSETDRLTIERDQAAERAKQATTQAAQRIAKTEAKGVARDLDARPDRLDAILRQADLSKAVNDDGEVDEAAVKTAVEKVLADYPEWKKGPGGPTSSGGELNGGGNNGKPTFTRKQLEDMPPQEMASRIDEINEAIADGRVTG